MSGDLRQCEACGAFWGRPQDLLDISQECWPVHGTLNNHRRRRGARAGDPAPGKLYLQNKSNAPTVPQAPYRALGTSSGATGAKLSAPQASVSRVDFEAGGLSNGVITSTRVGSASAFSRI